MVKSHGLIERKELMSMAVSESPTQHSTSVHRAPMWHTILPSSTLGDIPSVQSVKKQITHYQTFSKSIIND